MDQPAVAIYSRKSKFTGQGDSVENQVEMCRQYCRLHLEVDPQDLLIYEDEGFSGRNTRRPQFLTMMEDARRHKFTTIVCYRLDRVSRNIGDFARLIEELSRLSISFVSIKEQFDTSSPLGRAMMYIASVFSQLERETIAERIRDNMLELAKSGRWLGGVPPTGFSSQMVEHQGKDGKIRKSYRLAPIDSQLDIVRAVYRGYLSCKSLTQLENKMRIDKIQSKNGKPLRRFALRQILTNPVYAAADEDTFRYFSSLGARIWGESAFYDGENGLMVYNKTLQVKGRPHQIRPPQDWIVAPGQHPALIAGKDWVKVQRLLAHAPRGNASSPSPPPLLSGILICGHCGTLLRAKKTGRYTAEGQSVFYYLCRRKEREGISGCPCKNGTGLLLDAAVWKAVITTKEDIPTLLQCLRQYQRTISSQTAVSPGARDLQPCSSPAALLSLEGCLASLSIEEKKELIADLFDQILWDGQCLQLFPSLFPQREDSK